MLRILISKTENLQPMFFYVLMPIRYVSKWKIEQPKHIVAIHYSSDWPRRVLIQHVVVLISKWKHGMYVYVNKTVRSYKYALSNIK